MKQNILITGGAGFIGSNFLYHFVKKYPQHNIICIDSLTYASNLKFLSNLNQYTNYKFIKGDIRDRDFVSDIFKKEKITSVIHFAAESHVDNSIKNPELFIQSNVMGTFNLIHSAYSNWMDGPFETKSEFSSSRFHHISTDEVYGSLGEDGYFTEETPYAPNSPYSASKASSDMIVRSYFHTYGLNITISNCSNNYGPNQNSEKLIPTIINKAINQEPIPIYGQGTNVRDWLYVLDHVKAIDLIFWEGITGHVYNVGGNEEKTNLEVVKCICEFLDVRYPNNSPHYNLVTFVEDRPGHDLRYAIDASKISNGLSWMPEENFTSGIQKTIEWYLDNEIFSK